MRGVILAGGTGSRLLPMTRVTNKHLLPVYDRPMIFWPLKILLDNDVTEIMVITGREHAGHVFGLLGSGRDFACQFTFRVQDEAGGIAQALGLASDFVIADETGQGHAAVVLGDTIMLPSPVFPQVWREEIALGALVYLQSVPMPQAYGVVTWQGGEEKSIEVIVEKPTRPQSSHAVSGLYLYDAYAWDVIERMTPSARGELEITEVNNAYARRGLLDWQLVPGYWGDCGTIEGLYAAAVEAKKHHELSAVPR